MPRHAILPHATPDERAIAVRSLVAAAAGVALPDVLGDTRFKELELDSLDVVGVSIDIEDAFDRTFDLDESGDLGTVAELIALVEKAWAA